MMIIYFVFLVNGDNTYESKQNYDDDNDGNDPMNNIQYQPSPFKNELTQ